MLEDILAERARKRERYEREADSYPARVVRDVHIAEALGSFGRKKKSSLTLVGRVTSLRDQGKIVFANCADESGAIQLVLAHGVTKRFAFLKQTLDVGDFVEAKGIPTTTKRGTKSLAVAALRIAVKSMRPFPVHWYGLEDVETRLRKRYLDLLVHPETKELFLKKERFWSTIRRELIAEGFHEVETGVLEAVPGGADAEPFVTHLNALDADFYLRISLELPLKRLLVGGFEKVFEIGRVFRNEGIDREHLQDYTQMECYAAYWDYERMMRFTEALYKQVVKETTGGTTTKFGKETLKWNAKWKRVDYFDAFKKATGLDLAKATEKELRLKAVRVGAKPEPNAKKGRLIDLIYKKTVRPKLTQPCFLVDPPVEVEPLAKRLSHDRTRVARFQIVAGGTELGKGFSELNDPVDQRARFKEQEKARAAGDREAQRMDEDFIEALEYGMPPAAGFGLSERLFAILMDKPIRETTLFPLMRPEGKKHD
ncbi:MAG: lysine--tRNA ligase [Candidatus Brennerbacteria bacterium]|nr:lysine--tRNA ligase [Candidatus Brennerbacteria bacterium]